FHSSHLPLLFHSAHFPAPLGSIRKGIKSCRFAEMKSV
ncbi:unnamed protein product, partial [Prunus brigantina]